MTIHTAKGLEFPVVVLCGVEDDILPHINSAADEAGLEEERRLFYVALTRAERRVYLLHAMRRRRFGTWQDALPSRFLGEVPEALIERRRLNLGFGQGAGAGMTRPSTGAWGGGGGGARGGGQAREPVRPSTWTGGGSRAWTGAGGAAGGTGGAGTSAPRRVSPHEWGSSNRPRPAGPGAGARGAGARGLDEYNQDVQEQGAPSRGGSASEAWDHDVSQPAPYFEGQSVSHGIFGTGTVVRVEGAGSDMQVTVDFSDYGRKHLNPAFAPLVPLD